MTAPMRPTTVTAAILHRTKRRQKAARSPLRPGRVVDSVQQKALFFTHSCLHQRYWRQSVSFSYDWKYDWILSALVSFNKIREVMFIGPTLGKCSCNTAQIYKKRCTCSRKSKEPWEYKKENASVNVKIKTKKHRNLETLAKYKYPLYINILNL